MNRRPFEKVFDLHLWRDGHLKEGGVLNKNVVDIEFEVEGFVCVKQSTPSAIVG